MTQHELAAVYAEFIPKDRFFDYDNFQCVVFGDEVQADGYNSATHEIEQKIITCTFDVKGL